MSNYEEYQKALDNICNRCFGDGPKKVLQELVDKEKVLTLEEVKQEWEAKDYIWVETDHDIKLICKKPTTYLKIRLFKNSKSYQGIINLEEHQLITKTIRALGWI